MKHSLSIISLIVSCAALCLTLVVFYEKKEEKRLLLTKLENHIKACLDYNKEITQKEEIFSLLEQVAVKNSFVEAGSDDLRIKFVNFQSCMEHVLACSQAMGEITSLIGAIHTPTVATPLCVKPNEPISDQINDIQKQAEWGIWLGAVDNDVVSKRVNEIFDYLVSCNGPDLREML